MSNKSIRIGFVSTRLAGTDGVSLETAKWVRVLNNMGHECFFFAGKSDWPAERSRIVAEAYFNHPEIRTINADLFSTHARQTKTSQRVQVLKDHLKSHLIAFQRAFAPDVLIVENALSLPMNVPLGLALTEFIAETNIPVIAHHHDFIWERERYAISAGSDYLRAAFPPTLTTIHHVVINSFASRQLAMRTGERSTLVPNVMDFEVAPPKADAYAAELRLALGIRPDEFMLLQPTRVVPRKRIETSIELARRLGLPCALVISHDSGDEGITYVEYLREFADLLGVRLIFASDRVGPIRATGADGQKIFSLADAYLQADLVTYPSSLEGFGNAFLETMYYRRPIIMQNYEIFNVDIKPKGFKVLEFANFLDASVIAKTRALLSDPTSWSQVIEENYTIARRYYSFPTLENQLRVLLNLSLGT